MASTFRGYAIKSMNEESTFKTKSNFLVATTKCAGVYHVEPHIITDQRGYFFESFRQDILAEYFEKPFVQDNISFSKERGTLRGLHFQTTPHAQAKLVTVLQGEVLDVIVDLRLNSATYGLWESFVLSGEKKSMLFIPQGFAHGFCTRTNDVLFSYKCDAYYMPSADSGIVWNDPTLNIDWQLREEPLLSEKDAHLQSFEMFTQSNVFEKLP